MRRSTARAAALPAGRAAPACDRSRARAGAGPVRRRVRPEPAIERPGCARSRPGRAGSRWRKRRAVGILRDREARAVEQRGSALFVSRRRRDAGRSRPAADRAAADSPSARRATRRPDETASCPVARQLPGIGGEFGMLLPAQHGVAERDAMVLVCGFGGAQAARAQKAVSAARSASRALAGGLEGEVQHAPRRLDRREGARMHFAQHRGAQRMRRQPRALPYRRWRRPRSFHVPLHALQSLAICRRRAFAQSGIGRCHWRQMPDRGIGGIRLPSQFGLARRLQLHSGSMRRSPVVRPTGAPPMSTFDNPFDPVTPIAQPAAPAAATSARRSTNATRVRNCNASRSRARKSATRTWSPLR